MQLIWEEFLKIIKEEAGSQVVETWFKAVSLEIWDPIKKQIYLKVPNQFVSKWLQEHYLVLIQTHLKRLLNTNEVQIFFENNNNQHKQTQNNNKDNLYDNISGNNINPEKRNIIPASVVMREDRDVDLNNNNASTGTSLITRQGGSLEKKNKTNFSHLNTSYTFNSFIVGPSNSLAHAAGWAICQNVGKVYNPLFIYGGTGLGKTHLLHAIGNEIKKSDPEKIVRYETSDRFTNEFISSIRLDKIQYFRNKYQKVDLLLLDDIQFLSNKEQTQEMFFHIFNILYEQKKQIILSSDTFPKEIKGLQNRLKSRLEWGLVVDIQVPDLETKMAILSKKAEQNAIELNNDVANFIASRIKSNVRELEGALIRVGAFATLTNQPVTLELAKKVLLHLNEKKKDGIMLDNVIKVIAKQYSVSINELKGKKRQKNIATVRQVAFYMMKKLTFSSLQAIGEYVGKRDHSTVLHAIDKVERMKKRDSSFAQKLNVIEQEILMN